MQRFRRHANLLPRISDVLFCWIDFLQMFHHTNIGRYRQRVIGKGVICETPKRIKSSASDQCVTEVGAAPTPAALATTTTARPPPGSSSARAHATSSASKPARLFTHPAHKFRALPLQEAHSRRAANYELDVFAQIIRLSGWGLQALHMLLDFLQFRSIFLSLEVPAEKSKNIVWFCYVKAALAYRTYARRMYLF